MRCFLCGKEFVVERNFLTLFETKSYLVCTRCLKENPFEVSFHTIPLDLHTLEIVSLFEKEKYLDFNAFLAEYSQIYEMLWNKRKNALILMYDSFYLSKNSLEEMEQLSRMLGKDILILTFLYHL